MSNGYGAYDQGGNVVEEWGIVGHLAPVPHTPNYGDPPPAQLFSGDPGNGNPGTPWISVDSLGNLYVYGALVSGAVTVSPSGDTTGAADTAVIQARLNAATGPVILAAGTFYANGLTPVNAGRLTGAGKGVTTLNAAGGALWNMSTAGITQSFEIDHMTLAATGFDLITGGNLSRCLIHDCQLIQNSPGNYIWNGTALTQVIECRFYRNEEFIHGATRTVPAWNLVSPSVVVNQNVWRDNVTFNIDHDSTQYHYRLACTATGTNAGHRNNVFHNIAFEFPCGGMVRLESCTGTELDQLACWDLASLTVGNSMISVVRNNSLATGSVGTSIRSYARMGGANMSSPPFDIQIDANSLLTSIIAPSLTGGGAQLGIDLGNSAQVTLSGLPASYTLANATGATFADANGAAVLPWSSPQPEDLALAGWAFDPTMGVGSPGLALAAAGVLSVIKVPVRGPKSVSNVRIGIITAGATLTSGQNFIGIYNSAGTLIATSADQTTAWGGTGAITAALTGAPFTVGGPGSGGFIWVVLVWNGTTSPLLFRGTSPTGSQLLLNGNLGASSARWGSVSSGNTTLPASFTPSSIALGTAPWWAAVY